MVGSRLNLTLDPTTSFAILDKLLNLFVKSGNILIGSL